MASGLATAPAPSNEHMIAVNHTLGYRTTLTMVNVEVPAEALAHRLGSPG